MPEVGVGLGVGAVLAIGVAISRGVVVVLSLGVGAVLEIGVGGSLEVGTVLMVAVGPNSELRGRALSSARWHDASAINATNAQARIT